MKIAILIPCYNEAGTVGMVVREYKAVLPDADIYVYDNNSTDGTDGEARDAGALVRYERRQGKGNVLRTMFRDIEADCYLMVDGDDTYPPEYAKEMCRRVLEDRVDMVLGDRLSSTYFQENKRPFHNIGNLTVRWLINKIFGSDIKDIMTGYRALSRSFVKNFPVLSCGFEIETEMTVHALDKNFRIESLPVDYRDRPEGSVSKLNTFTDGVKVIKTIFRLFRDFKPYLFFSIISVLLLALAAVLFVPVFLEYLDTGLVRRFPTLIVSGFVVMLAMLLWICGLILQVMSQKHRVLYEMLSNKVS